MGRYTTSLILELDSIWGEWSDSRFGRLIFGERTPLCIEYEAGWAPELVWALRRREKSLFLCEQSNHVPSDIVS